jgi:outer membrane receptor protein involved in Fe transport
MVGNPALKPTDTDSFEVEYNYSRKAFNFETALFYRVNSNLVSQVTTSRSDGYLITMPVNAGRSHSAGVELTLKAPIAQYSDGGILKYSVNTNLSDINLRRIGVGERDYFAAEGNGQIEYDAPSGDQYQANLTLSGKTYSVQGYTRGLYRIDVSYQHPLSKKLALTVSVTDLTNSGRTVTVIDLPGLRSRTVSQPSDQALRVGLSWKFGLKAQ